ncbi:MAG: hypothetical protein FRX49_07762 [Trebouxia sp. A1-2]|nr:MAG: hypothetical protein FRX49_07762 [Trebouxia sp. A1-2]
MVEEGRPQLPVAVIQEVSSPRFRCVRWYSDVRRPLYEVLYKGRLWQSAYQQYRAMVRSERTDQVHIKHPDLRMLLTGYGVQQHLMQKDPLQFVMARAFSAEVGGRGCNQQRHSKEAPNRLDNRLTADKPCATGSGGQLLPAEQASRHTAPSQPPRGLLAPETEKAGYTYGRSSSSSACSLHLESPISGMLTLQQVSTRKAEDVWPPSELSSHVSNIGAMPLGSRRAEVDWEAEPSPNSEPSPTAALPIDSTCEGSADKGGDLP